MAVRTFEVAPDAKPKRQTSENVGTFKSGAQDENGKPMSLPTWRVTTAEPEVAQRIAELLGGEVRKWDTKSAEKLEVITEVESVRIIVDRIHSEMVLWGRNGKIRSCDGVMQKDGETPDACSECVCPVTIKERKAEAKKGTGCEPSVGVYFRLLDEPELGSFKLYSSSWNILDDIQPVEEKLAAIGGSAEAILAKETVSWEKDGQRFSYQKFTVNIVGPYVEESE